MYKLKYRPGNFDELIGQEIPKSILKKVVASPEGKPQCFILQGSYGLGKTSVARIFARAINCRGKVKPCGECDVCLEYKNLEDSPYYYELDSAMVGNVDSIKSYRETWGNLPRGKYTTIVLDESQVISPAAQSALLNFTENVPDKMFVFFPTTNVEKLAEPLVSRSMVLDFIPLTESEIGLVVDRIVKEEGIQVSEESKKLIQRRSLGHARDAVSLLERYVILGEEDFKKSVVIVDNLILGVIKAAVEDDKEKAKVLIGRLQEIPLVILLESVEKVIKRMIEATVIEKKVIFDKITEQTVMKILSFYAKFKNITNSSTIDFCSFLMGLFSYVRQEFFKEKIEITQDPYKKK